MLAGGRGARCLLARVGARGAGRAGLYTAGAGGLRIRGRGGGGRSDRPLSPSDETNNDIAAEEEEEKKPREGEGAGAEPRMMSPSLP